MNADSESIQPRALVVEDHPATRRFFRASLKHIGWDVAEASTAAEGLKIFNSFHPQVVTLDVVMAHADGMSSVDLLHAIREAAPATAVFMVTGVSNFEEREIYLREGASGFFLKPVLNVETFEALFKEIQSVRTRNAG